MSSALVELSNGFVHAVERGGNSVVSVNEGGQSGVSGTVWRDGLIVTAEHTVRGQQELTIVLPTGASATATVIGRDSATDIALLRVKDSATATAEFAEAAELRVGQFVLALARRGSHGMAASHGIISALGGAWRTWRGGRIDQSFRLDLLPFTGFSGGPLVDAQGKIIGINTSGARRSVITVPTATLNRVVDQLLAKGRIPRGFLGLALQPVRLAKVPASSGAARGLVVVMVEPGGPAEKGGLTVGDILLGVGDQPLADTADLQTALDPEQVGTTLTLRVLRGGQVQDLALTVAERQE